MINTHQHILSDEGILTSFSISKRITSEDFARVKKKLKNKNLSSEDFQQMLKQKIVDDLNQNIKKCSIPGLNLQHVLDEESEKKKMMELTYIATVLGKNIQEKTTDSFYKCFLINAIINVLGLTEEDFNEFHKRFSKYNDGEDSDEGYADSEG